MAALILFILCWSPPPLCQCQAPGSPATLPSGSTNATVPFANLLPVPAAAPGGVTPAVTPAPVTHYCTLDIQGTTDDEGYADGGIEYAGFHCNSSSGAGGNSSTAGAVLPGVGGATPGVMVAINDTYLANFSSNFTGVELLSPENCGTGLGCLITVCGTPGHVIMSDARISGLLDPELINGVTGGFSILCFSGDLYVTIDGMKAEANTANSLCISGNAEVGIPEVSIQGFDCLNSYMGVCIYGASGPATIRILNSSFSYNEGDVRQDAEDQVVGVNVQGNATLVYISGTNFSGTSQAGAVSMTGSGVLSITNSIFFDNSDASALTAVSDDDLRVNMENTTFLNNTKESTVSGSAVLIGGNTTFIVRSSLFQDNSLLGAPGAALRCADRSHVVLSSCLFINNTVEGFVGGGALSVGEHAVVVVNNHTEFLRNTAKIASGGAMAVRGNATVVLTDSCLFGGNHADLNGGAILAFENAAVNVTGGTFFRNNSANGTGTDVQANQDNNLILGETSINARSLGVSWLRKKCIVGEFKDASSGMCEQCPRSMYSLSEAQFTKDSCEQCPDNANCTGGFSIIPLAGFWQSSSNSTQIHSCPRTNSCLADGVSCAPGYEGRLCGKCVEGWGSEGPFKCGQCMPIWKILLIFSSVVFALVVSTRRTPVSPNLRQVRRVRQACQGVRQLSQLRQLA